MFVNNAKKNLQFQDIIFKNNSEARKRAEDSSLKVINGTIGALLDDDGRLVTFESVDSVHRALDVKSQSGYAPMDGYPGFQKAAEYFCFGSYRPQTKKIRTVSVSGGLGGIHQAVVNYTEPGDEIITTDWFWGPYEAIVKETGRRLRTVEMNQGGTFNLEGFGNEVRRLGAAQDSVFILLNTPAHNPTGYSVREQDFKAFIEMLNGMDTRVVLFLDTAYMEMASPGNKAMFSHLDHAADNIFTIVDYSISKGFTKYGLRTAALMGIHSSETALDEFFHSVVLSNRATYGSCSSTGQLLLKAMHEEREVLNRYEKERDKWRAVLAERAAAFFSVIDPRHVMPYDEGFFASVLCGDPGTVTEKLKDEHIFLVPLKKGIRVALCSIKKEDCARVAEVLNRMLDHSE